MNYNIQLSLLFGESQVWYPNSPFYHIFDLNRDAIVEGRSALDPTDEDIRSSDNIESLDDEPFGIENTQAHDMVIPIDLNPIQPVQIDENQIFITDETRATGVLNNGRLNQTNSVVHQTVPPASIEEIQQTASTRNEDVHQTITAAICSTNAHRRIHHNQIESNGGPEEESPT